MNADFRG